MIFTRTADGAQKLALLLRNLSFAAIPIYGKMSQDKRIGALNKFKAGQCSILVATGQPDAFKDHLHPDLQCWVEHHVHICVEELCCVSALPGTIFL